MAKKLDLVDFHIHTNHSSDAVLSPQEVIQEAKRVGATDIAFADHNDLGAPIELWKKLGADPKDPYVVTEEGIRVISCVEVTCRVNEISNNKGSSSTKIHMLVYGADLSKDSPIVRLMKIKSKNDHDCDFGLLEYFLSQNPKHGITQQHINQYIQSKRETHPGYSYMSADDVREFLEEHGITLARSNRQYRKLVKEAPKYDRLNIDVKDLIKVAHASGGLCVFAHPSTNLKRTDNKAGLLATLFRLNLDGIEKFYNGSTPKNRKMLTSAVLSAKPKNPIIYTAGSDTHDFSRGRTIGKWNVTQPIHKRDNLDLIEEIERLDRARKKGKLTHRNYPHVYASDIDDIITSYEILSENLVRYSEPCEDTDEMIQ